jgi:hypothetical protein
MGVESLDHLEQVGRGFHLVSQDERRDAALVGGPVEVPPPDVGRHPLLSALQQQRADAPGALPLRLKSAMDVPLGAVQHEGHNGPRLGPDAQERLGIRREIVRQPRPGGKHGVHGWLFRLALPGAHFFCPPLSLSPTTSMIVPY